MTIETEESTKSFLADLRQRAGRPLKIRINNNRSTMLNVQWKQDHTSVSLHRLFVGAPGDVMESLANYLRGDERKLSPAIKAYIEQQIGELDYSSRVDKSCLRPVGVMYDLQEIFDQINHDYFESKLSILITWYGAAQQRFRKSITFGIYDDVMKLIKIHRILDHKAVPRFVVEFIIYHEMLHHVCRPYVDGKGINRIHHPLFRAREKEHRYYGAATEWIRHHKEALFQGLIWKDKNYGWT